MKAAKKAVTALALAGALSVGTLITSNLSLEVDKDYTSFYVRKLWSTEGRSGTLSNNAFLYDKAEGKKISMIKRGTKVRTNGRYVIKGKVYYQIFVPNSSINNKSGLIQAKDLSLNNLDKNFSLKEMLSEPERSVVQKWADYIVDKVSDKNKKERERLKGSRVDIAMKLIYESGREYEQEHAEFLRQAATKEIGQNMDGIIEYFERFEDYRFVDVIVRRLKSGEIEKFGQRPGYTRTTEEKAVQFLAKAAPSFMLREALMRLSGPLEKSEKGIYTRGLMAVGGDKAINYFMQSSKKDGYPFSWGLMESVRNQKQAQRVHEFLLRELPKWKEKCANRHYVLQDFRKFEVKYGFGEKAIPCTSHDRFCYFRPFGIDGLGLDLGCDPLNCTCSGGYR